MLPLFLIGFDMGLFSSKTKTYTSATAMRMLENSDIVDIHQAATLEFTLSNNSRVDVFATNFNDCFNNQVKNSIGVNAIRISNWAEKRYAYGTPKGKTINLGRMDLVAIVEDYLTKKLNGVPTVVYSKLGAINNNHAVYQMLMDRYGYSFESNSFLYNGNKVYLSDFVIAYSKSTVEGVINPSYLDPLGYSPKSGAIPNVRGKGQDTSVSSWVYNDMAPKDYVEVYYNNGNGVKGSFTLDFLSYEWSGKIPEVGEEAQNVDAKDYFMFSYIFGGVTKVSTFVFGNAEAPELDSAINAEVDPGKYLPNIYVFKNKILQTDPSLKDSEEYKTSVKLCNELRLDYQQVVDNIYEGIKDESSVQNCYCTFSLAVNDFKDPIIQEYMYNHFYELYKDTETSVRSNYQEEKEQQILTQSRGGLSTVISDKAVSSSLSFTSIGTRLKTGVIGDVGFCKGELTTTSKNLGYFSSVSKVTTHVFSKQITANTYREIHVIGLTTSYSVSGGSDVFASGNDDLLLIPLDIDVAVKRMSRYRNELVSKSMHVVVTTKQTVKVKWYERGVFKLVLFVIAVVVTVMFPPAGIAAYSLMAAAYAVAVSVLASVAITLVSKLLYAMGVREGIVMAALAIIVIAYGGYAALGKTTVFGLNATQLLGIANVSFSISNNITAMQMAARYKSYLEYTDRMDQELEDLEQHKKDLGLDIYKDFDIYEMLAPSVYQPDIRLGESPVDFLNRVTSVNESVSAYLQLIPNYVYLATRLPTIEDTLKGKNSYVR